MDRGRKAMPIQNKVCMKRILLKNQERHQKKLENAKANIDNSCPVYASHLKSTAKRRTIVKDRCAQIECDNLLLLRKLTEIKSRKPEIDDRDGILKFARSVFPARRAKDERRIGQENLRILNRIQSVKATYSKKVWEDDARRHDHVLNNISEYKTDAVKKNSIPKIISVQQNGEEKEPRDFVF